MEERDEAFRKSSGVQRDTKRETQPTMLLQRELVDIF